MVRFQLRHGGTCVRAGRNAKGLPATPAVQRISAGEFRLAINGESGCLRWQVARKAL